MLKNVGSADKIIRIAVGLGVIGWGIYAKSWLGIIGAVPLATAMMNFCPLYGVCGIKTNKAEMAAK